ncbi:hypothetical protein EYF80_002369 [Liparis tanakae]|uniref:Uncharacterized protein n=1 Tax=Liparis tanakae TaxID=230148 RepID=A0A4Z2JAY5_9TELE|nr:hypothetical protein EYF80_002369 [Liparis tanakae]
MDVAPEMMQLLINWLQRDGGDSVKEIRPVRLREILRSSVPDFQRHRTARGGTIPCKQWHNIKAVTRWRSSDAEASGEWVEKRGAATDHVINVHSKLRVPVPVKDCPQLTLQGLGLPYRMRSMLGNHQTHSSCELAVEDASCQASKVHLPHMNSYSQRGNRMMNSQNRLVLFGGRWSFQHRRGQQDPEERRPSDRLDGEKGKGEPAGELGGNDLQFAAYRVEGTMSYYRSAKDEIQRSSGVTGLLTPSPGLGPPPRLDTGWIDLQSRGAGGREGRTPDEEETTEALQLPSCPLGSKTVLKTPKLGNKGSSSDGLLNLFSELLCVLSDGDDDL